jgi:GDP-L-fucose synthase
MNTNSKIFIAGHKGLVGSAVHSLLKKKGYKNLITVDKKKLDLRNSAKVEKFFKSTQIDYMIMAAARAGGILANSHNQKDFFLENIEIQNSLLKLTLIKNIKRTIFLGTSCIYPKYSKTPIKEESLLSGKLEKTNECYAIAKIAGIKLCEALFENYKKDIICLMPTNVYGKNDHFDKFNGHVIPAMITKFIEAKKKNKKKIRLLGTGKPLREFIHSDDLADAILFCLKLKKIDIFKIFRSNLPIMNVGTKDEIKIKSLSELIRKYVKFHGVIEFDKNYPDGTLRKNLDKKKIRSLGWFPKIEFKEGLREVVKSRTG